MISANKDKVEGYSAVDELLIKDLDTLLQSPFSLP